MFDIQANLAEDGKTNEVDDVSRLFGDNLSLSLLKMMLAFSVRHSYVRTTLLYPRDAMLARYWLSSCVRPSVCLSVRLSVSQSVCLPQAQLGVLLGRLKDHAMMQIMSYDRSGNLVCWCQRSRRNPNWVNLNAGPK